VAGTPVSALTADVTAGFDLSADRYDAVGPALAGPTAARLTEIAGPRPGWQVLDVGCGAGAVLTRVAPAVQPGGHVTGIDLAPRMLDRAAREAAARGLTGAVTLLRGDAASPPLPPASFDAVLSSLVLYLLPDQAAALRAWRDLLRPGGTLAFSRSIQRDPRWAPVLAAVDAYAEGAAGFESHAARPGPLSQTEDLVRDSGFADVASTVETVTLRYESPEQFWAASSAEGPVVTWQHIPAARLPEARATALAMAEALREPDGQLLRHIKMAYVTARRPESG
jgi:SAM-dependent methyltransferase